MKAAVIAQSLGAALVGVGDLEIARAVHPAEARCGTDLAVALSPGLAAQLAGCKAGAALVPENAPVPAEAPPTLILVRLSRRTLPQATALFGHRPALAPGIHPSAIVESGATVAPSARVGVFCDIAADVAIGEDTVLVSHCSVSAGSTIGAGCVLHSGVRIGPGVRIGDRAIIHANAVVGADGFSFLTVDEGHVETAKRTGTIVPDPDADATWQKIHSLGGVVIGDDVEIGALSAIDAGTLRPTRIGRGTKIDDLVMIGHNVEVGEDCLLCGNVGIAGSSVIGSRVVLAGGVGVADHLTVGDDVIVGAAAGVGTNLRSGAVYLGAPAVPQKSFMRDLRNIRRLDRLFGRSGPRARPDAAPDA